MIMMSNNEAVGLKILIVDDDAITLEMLRTTLNAAGHDVEMASDGQEALERIAQGDIRLVITDWEMPRLDGLALCRAVRRQASAGYVYLILLTTHGTPDEIVEGMSAGADDFVVKPFNQAELNARVHAGARVLSLETREMVIFALAKLAESRDTDTGLHLERVQRYSRRLAESLVEMSDSNRRLDADLIRLIYQTSPLHDIGKVGIPDRILLKPGRLTEEEFNIMKTHTTIGARTLEEALANYPQARFLQVAREIAASHHERWDGSGYPQGLAGEEIPLSARIVAVADVFDALTSRRSYKDPFSHQVARDIIGADAGTHFDPVVVQAFFRAEEDFVEIKNRFSEQTTGSNRNGASDSDDPTLALV